MALDERQLVGRVLDPLPNHVQLPLEAHGIGRKAGAAGRIAAVADKQLLHDRHHARTAQVCASSAPGRQPRSLAFVAHHVDERPDLFPLAGIAR